MSSPSSLWGRYASTAPLPSSQPQITFSSGNKFPIGGLLTFLITGFAPNTNLTFGVLGAGSGTVKTDSNGGGNYEFTFNEIEGAYTLYAKQDNGLYTSATFYVISVTAPIVHPTPENPWTQKPLETTAITISVWNPFNYDLNNAAHFFNQAMKDAIAAGKIAASMDTTGIAIDLHLQFLMMKETYKIDQKAGKITLYMDEFGPNQPNIIPVAVIAAVIVVAIVAGVIAYSVSVAYETGQTTQQLTTSADLIKQIDNNPDLTPAQKDQMITSLFPKGVPSNANSTDPAAGLGNVLGTLNTVIPVIAVVAVLGAMSSFVKRGKD